MCAQPQRKATLDPSFGDGGKVILRRDGKVTHAYDMATGSDDSIFVALMIPSGDLAVGSYFGVAKLSADGRIDPRFGIEGYAVHPGPGGTIEIKDGANVTIEPGARPQKAPEPGTIVGIGAEALRPFVLRNGKILLHCTVGPPLGGATQIPFLAQFNPDGTIDESFGEKGKRYFDFEEHVLDRATVIPMPDGKIAMVCRRLGKDGAVDGLIMRLTEAGENDASFGNAGIQPIVFPGGLDGSTACAVVQEETFVVGGYNPLQGLIRRFSADGGLDATFGGEGTYRLPEVENADGEHPQFETLLLTTDNDLIGIGTMAVPRENIRDSFGFLVGIDHDGRPNTAFGDGKPVWIPKDYGQTSLSRGTFDLSGNLVVAGSPSGQINPSGFVVARYSPSGVPDESFGPDGCQIIRPGEHLEIARGLAIQRSGNMLLSGQIVDISTPPTTSNGVVARLKIT